jgi:hypothetical protein
VNALHHYHSEYFSDFDLLNTAAPPDPIRQEIYGHIKKFLDMGGTRKTD